MLLAIGAIADARSNHPRLLIVRRHQTVGRSKRQALADTGTGDAWLMLLSADGGLSAHQ